MKQKTFKRVEEGAKNSWKLKKKEDLLNVMSKFWRNLNNLGLRSVFYYEDAFGVFHHVFENPDSASLQDLHQWETTLITGCSSYVQQEEFESGMDTENFQLLF